MRKTALIFLFTCATLLCAQRYTVNGYVTDRLSGERLIGATVYDSISHLGVITNTAGFYSLTLPSANAALQASYVGYGSSPIQMLHFTADTLLSFALSSNTQLDDITVIGTQSVSGPNAVQMSAIEVPVEQIKSIPMIAGEVDIIKAIQLLPGVQSGTEGAAGLYVRGGGPDENLIILDGVPIYSVNHLMGFFSVFNADAIKNVTLYKGNFPAQYGGRLSSIIDVRQNDGNTHSYHGNLTVGLLASKFNIEGPIPHKKDSTGTTTFNISARRTYFDLFVAPLVGLVGLGSSEGTLFIRPGAYFYDVNAKLTHTFANQNDKLSATFYMGDDAVYFNIHGKEKNKNQVERNSTDMRMMWGNIVAATNWEHRFTPRLFANTQLSYTQYRYFVNESIDEQYHDEEDSWRFQQGMSYRSDLRDIMLQSNFAWTPRPNNTLHFGAAYTYHQFRPEIADSYIFSYDTTDPDANMQKTNTLNNGHLHGHEAILYAEDAWTPWKWLKLNLGARATLYAIDGKVYPSIEPRIGLRALLCKDLSFKASYAYTTQYIHLLSNSSISLPTDLWVPVTKDIPPMHSMIAAAGLSYNILNQVEISVEGYYKYSTNLLEYKEGATFFGAETGWQDKVSLGNGWSYGVELLLQRKCGPVTGWIGYTWARTMRLFNRPGQEINFGRPFRAKYDREHDLSVVVQYTFNRHVDIAATFVYGTGTRATFATQNYYDPSNDNLIKHITERNNYQLPDYHRLDLGVNLHFPHKYSTWGQTYHTRRQQRRIWNKTDKRTQHQKIYNSGKYAWCKDAEHLLNISLYNAYCHDNPFMMQPEFDKLYQISLFPILPSISYTFKF